jgi:tetratricopeptide (TPR) repeat protein
MTALNVPEAMQQAVAHHRAGQLAQAEGLYRQVLAVTPRHADALNLLGELARQSGRPAEAVDLINRAIAICAIAPEYFVNLGAALDDLGRLDEEIAAFQKALTLRPDYPMALSNLGNALRKRSRTDEAIAACRRALALQPNYAIAHNNLGAALQSTDLDQAIAHHRQALTLQPTFPGAHAALAAALVKKGDFDEAIASCNRALSLQPNNPQAFQNLASALAGKGNIDQAIQCLRQSLALTPNLPLAHWNLGLLLLLTGDFAQGWPEYEWRLRVPELATPAVSDKPKWDGSPLAARRILLTSEQGLGDVIQFIRYVPLVIARGGQPVISCQRELHRLLHPMPCIAQGDPPPDHDLQCSLMSLPGLFGTTIESIPAPIPYLRADPSLSAHWQSRLAQSPHRRIGLVWSGRSAQRADRNRSIPPAALAPLAAVDGVFFCSLQKDPAPPPPLPHLADWTADLHDFADTAALIENLDLVITIDTAVAHLAGAMGRPTWLLLKHHPDWRWLLHRSDSPWYPTMRLFRQTNHGDWTDPIAQIVDALRQF